MSALLLINNEDKNFKKDKGVTSKCDSIKRISRIIENIHTNFNEHDKKTLHEIIDETEKDLIKSIEKAKLEKASRFSRLVNFPISHNQRLTITPSLGVPISPLPSAKRDTTVDISVSRNHNFNKTSNFILSYEREKDQSLSLDIDKDFYSKSASKTPGVNRESKIEELKENSSHNTELNQAPAKSNNESSEIKHQYTKRLKYLSEIIEIPIRGRTNNDGDNSRESSIRGVKATFRTRNKHSNEGSNSNKSSFYPFDQIYPTPINMLNRKQRLKYVMKKKYINMKIKSKVENKVSNEIEVEEKRRYLSPQNFSNCYEGSQQASHSSRSNQTAKMSKKEKLIEIAKHNKLKYFGRPSCIE